MSRHSPQTPVDKSSIPFSNPKVSLHLNLPDPACIRNEAHQALSDILDLIILMEKVDMALDCCRWVVPGWGLVLALVKGSLGIKYCSLGFVFAIWDSMSAIWDSSEEMVARRFVWFVRWMYLRSNAGKGM